MENDALVWSFRADKLCSQHARHWLCIDCFINTAFLGHVCKSALGVAAATQVYRVLCSFSMTADDRKFKRHSRVIKQLKEV